MKDNIYTCIFTVTYKYINKCIYEIISFLNCSFVLVSLNSEYKHTPNVFKILTKDSWQDTVLRIESFTSFLQFSFYFWIFFYKLIVDTQIYGSSLDTSSVIPCYFHEPRSKYQSCSQLASYTEQVSLANHC